MPVVLPRVRNYLEVVQACLDGRLDNVEIKQDDDVYFGIVGASNGYPSDYSNVKGKRIFGLEDAMAVDACKYSAQGLM